jgi:hypothetical protein
MGGGNGGIVPRVPNRGARRRKVFSFHPATLRPGKVPLGASEQEGGRTPQPDWKPDKRIIPRLCQESNYTSLGITVTVTITITATIAITITNGK